MAENSLTTLARELGAECISDDACADYLQVPSGTGDMEILTPLPTTPGALDFGVRQVYSIGVEEQSEWDAIAVGTQCKQIGASAYCSLNNSPDFNVVVASARLLLALCSLKGSSAYGVSNTNLLAAIPGALLRAVLNELKFPGAKGSGQNQKPVATARAKRTVTLSLELGTQGGELRRSARAPAAAASQTQSQRQEAAADEEEDGEAEAEAEDEDQFDAEEEQGEEDARPRRAGKTEASLRVSPAGLRALVVELGRRVSLFWQRSDDFPLESCIEGLSAAAFLAAMRPEFGLVAGDAASALAALGLSGERGMMSLFKSLLPALTMSGRDVRLPDVALHKLRAQCQRAAADVAAKVMARCTLLQHANAEVNEARAEDEAAAAAAAAAVANASVCPPAPSSPSAGAKKAAEEERTPGVVPRKSRADKARDVKAAKAAAVAAASAAAAADAPPSPAAAAAVPFRLALPTPYACAVGLLQRMTVGVPDRAQPRGVVLTSLALLLRALAEAGGSDEAAPEARAQGRAAAFHYLLFLEKLSRSTKTTHRAYSLDIAVVIMACDWLWDVDVGADGAVASTAAVGAPATLVAMVLGRCRDVASTVRSRAIGALSDLLDSLGPSSPRAMAEILRTAAMGGDLASLGAPALAPGARACSLLDTLRDRAADDKPLVRAKAVQAFGRAFCLDWPSCAPAPRSAKEDEEDMCLSPAADVHWSQLLLLEEDVGVLVLGCGDKALSGRKQALTSLTALVQARPRDARLQAAWVAAALPLASDPESSVQAKVAQCCHALLVEGAVAWASLPENKEAPPSVKGRGARVESPLQQEEQRAQASLAWALLDAIALAGQGHSKLLRTAVTGMLQQGLLGTGPSGVKSVVSAIKTACCANLGGQEGQDEDEEGKAMVAPASVARGGWVLLEALLSPDAGRDANSQAAASLTLGQAGSGSADFVVRCFLSQVHGDSLQGGSDTAADCVRMLRVLEKVAPGVSAGDAAKVGRKLQQLLVGMQCDAGFVAAAVAVRFALSKAAGAGAGADKGLSDAVCAEVVQWAGQLLASAHAVLYGGVWASLPERADSLYPLEDLDCAPSSAVKAALLADRRDGLGEAAKGALTCALFLVGELAMLGFSVEEDEPKRGAAEDSGKPSFSVSPAARAFRMCLPAPLVVLVQMLMDARLPNSEALSSVCDLLHEAPTARGPATARLPCPDAVRAHAFVTMGKLCLRDRIRARDHVNVFLRELVGHAHTSQDASYSSSSSSSSAAIRSNCLLVLGDLCVRYTNLVDRHIGAMAACLQDIDVLVRRHALVMLTQLLLQDYLKWRGLLLFRFLAAAVDTDNETAELARVVLRSTLLVRSPDFFSQHLAEAVLIFNGCCDHPAYVAAASCGSEGASSLVTMDGVILGGGGPRERARRLRLYGVMMESFSDEQRIHVTAKLVQDVLSYAIDHAGALQVGAGSGSEGSAFEHALEDALLILQSPLLRVGRRADTEDGDEEGGGEEEEAGGGAQDKKGRAAGLAGAKSKVLKSLSKQHLVAHTLPVVASLKHVLEAARSPLQGALMDFLLCLVRNHRAECAEAFEADPCLKGEVEYDLKQHERNKAQREAQRLAEEAERAQREAQGPVAAKDRRLSRGLPPASPGSGMGPSNELSPVPALRRSLGGPGSAARTPRQALLLGGGRREAIGEEEANAAMTERLLGACMAGGAGIELQSHASRRRSWSVVVGRLEPGENADPNPNPSVASATPAKKKSTKAKSPTGEEEKRVGRPTRSSRFKA